MEKTKKKVLVVFGTRPEAIKMGPLVLEMKRRGTLVTKVCATGQHREMLDQVLKLFDIKPDYDLGIMRSKQTLFNITARILDGLERVLDEYEPDMVFVHGDTTTAFASSLVAYYKRIPVSHVEAGLRTYNIYSPFPEEYNRQAVAIVARLNFAPTQKAGNNLRIAGVPLERIFVTGNTAIDAMKTTVREDYRSEITDWAAGSRLIVMTAHRRENLGEPMHHMFRAVRRIVQDVKDVKVIYPVHMNPVVRSIAKAELAGGERIRLIDPMNVLDFHNLINHSYFVLTDSGGIQEEAPALGKPVLVMRDTTERPEGIEAGTLRLVGTDEESIYCACRKLLDDSVEYMAMRSARNPYGNGTAAIQIADIVEKFLLGE